MTVKEKDQSVETELEMALMLGLADKDFKVAIINMFKEFKDKHL